MRLAALQATVIALAIGCSSGEHPTATDEAGAETTDDEVATSDAEASGDETEPADEPADSGMSADASRANDAAAARDASRPTDAGAASDASAAVRDASLADGAVSAGAQGTPPATWTEHWFEHDRTLKLVDHNEWVALYFDDEVNRANTSWLLPFMTRVWKYTVEHYGQFTDGKRDGRLYAIYHQGKYSGGHPSTYFDASHDYRNVSDVGPGPFS